MKQVKLLATEFNNKKYHIYDCKTTGKHPVHIIEGGDLITLDERVFNICSDLGWFFLNTREYNLLLENLREITIEVPDNF